MIGMENIRDEKDRDDDRPTYDEEISAETPYPRYLEPRLGFLNPQGQASRAYAAAFGDAVHKASRNRTQNRCVQWAYHLQCRGKKTSEREPVEG